MVFHITHFCIYLFAEQIYIYILSTLAYIYSFAEQILFVLWISIQPSYPLSKTNRRRGGRAAIMMIYFRYAIYGSALDFEDFDDGNSKTNRRRRGGREGCHNDDLFSILYLLTAAVDC